MEVLQPGWVFTPNIEFYSSEGECLFEVFDVDSDWRRRPRPVGRYVLAAWIPGNLLSEGVHRVNVMCVSFEPHRELIKVEAPVGFSVVDSYDGTSARGDFTGEMIGVVRPMVKWTTQFVPSME